MKDSKIRECNYLGESTKVYMKKKLIFPYVFTNCGSIWFVDKQVGQLSKARVNGLWLKKKQTAHVS